MIEGDLVFIDNQHKLRIQEAQEERLKQVAIKGRNQNANSVWGRFFRSPRR